MRSLRAAGFALAVGLCCLACGSDGVSSDDPGASPGGGGGGDSSMISLAGTVYGNANTGVGCSPACSYANPIPGAQITVSLDGTSVRTDASGKFSLVTKTRASSTCLEYTVTIAAQGYTTYQMSAAWGNHADGKIFALAPPLPNQTQVQHC